MDQHPRKLIFINRYFFPDHSATSQMLSDLAFGLVEPETEPQIHIVTSRQRYDEPQAQLPEFEIIEQVHIHRIATTRFGRQNLLGRAIDYLSFYFSAAIKLLQITRKGDTLIAKTDPPLISLIVALVAKFKKAILINWLQDLFPEVAAQLGVKLARGLPYKILKSLRNKTLKQAKMNVVIGELMAQRLRNEGIPEQQITVIHNWADGEQLKPIPHEQNPLRKEWGVEGKFVIGYSGNLGRGHDFNAILTVAEAQKGNENIQFLIIGGGAQLSYVKQECAARELSNVTFKPYQPRENLSESLSVADVHLISLKPELESLIVPSKLYGVLAVGRLIIFIGSKNGELASIIKANNCGKIVEQNNVDELKKVIEELFFQRNEIASGVMKVRDVFINKYSKIKAVIEFKNQLLTN